jgi:hypothetical protein
VAYSVTSSARYSRWTVEHQPGLDNAIRHRYRESLRYPTASAACRSAIRSLPSRSAIVAPRGRCARAGAHQQFFCARTNARSAAGSADRVWRTPARYTRVAIHSVAVGEPSRLNLRAPATRSAWRHWIAATTDEPLHASKSRVVRDVNRDRSSSGPEIFRCSSRLER